MRLAVAVAVLPGCDSEPSSTATTVTDSAGVEIAIVRVDSSTVPHLSAVLPAAVASLPRVISRGSSRSLQGFSATECPTSILL